MSCDCLGTGLLEIKCPFTYKHSVLSDIDDEKIYLQRNGNGEFMLSKTHQYYFQVQAQLSTYNKQYSDFVVGLHAVFIWSAYMLIQSQFNPS